MKHAVLSTSPERSSAARLSYAEGRHRELEGRIQEMKRRTWLSQMEQVELSRLKKLKLQVKDEIASLSRSSEKARPSTVRLS